MVTLDIIEFVQHTCMHSSKQIGTIVGEDFLKTLNLLTVHDKKENKERQRRREKEIDRQRIREHRKLLSLNIFIFFNGQFDFLKRIF